MFKHTLKYDKILTFTVAKLNMELDDDDLYELWLNDQIVAEMQALKNARKRKDIHKSIAKLEAFFAAFAEYKKARADMEEARKAKKAIRHKRRLNETY